MRVLSRLYLASLLVVAINDVRGLTEEEQQQFDDLQKMVTAQSMQIMMNRFYEEEKMRSAGNSGVKRVRGRMQGTHSYHSASYVDDSVASIHDHHDHIRSVGMGEIIAVLNGVEFRTRHTDFMLRQKHGSSAVYKATEDIEFPAVPPEVTNKATVEEEIEEMWEWFNSWAEQNSTVRDYRDYFKPILCYLEGSWTHADQDTIQEPFYSARHWLDADSWYQLQEKIRYTSYSGHKDKFENFAYLPFTVFDMINGTVPVLAQWNYQVLCHPLADDLPLDRFRLRDGIKTRMSKGYVNQNSWDQYKNSRAAHYDLEPEWEGSNTEGQYYYTLLDDLMEEIPGFDNYQGNCIDDALGFAAYPLDVNVNVPLNACYYHRVYRVKEKGAMGQTLRYRGFADDYLFMALTTQEEVPGLPATQCNPLGRNCQEWFQRWSYAIPLEILYLTPLANWNPYNITYKGDADSEEGQTVYDGPNGEDRDGDDSADKAFNGTNSMMFYITPAEFFEDVTGGGDPADTALDSTHVLDSENNVRKVRAAGVRTLFPEIAGIDGYLRQRFPIMPIHEEGSSVYKVLDALKEIVLKSDMYKNLYTESESSGNVTVDPEVVTVYYTQPSDALYGSHSHSITLTVSQAETLLGGGIVENVYTSEASSHTHNVQLGLKGASQVVMKRCDGTPLCFDGHPRQLLEG